MGKAIAGWCRAVLLSSVLALVAAGCSSSGNGDSGGGDAGGAAVSTAPTSLTVQTLAGGTTAVADGTYVTACRTCEGPSANCSDKTTLVISGPSFTFTTDKYTDLACTAGHTVESDTGTGTVDGTAAAGCFTYTPTAGAGSQAVPSCASVGLAGSPTASKMSFATAVGTIKGLAVVDTAGASPILYIFDDRSDCSSGYCTGLSTFGHVKQ